MKHQPISTKFPHMLHGGDYNPDQWLDSPDILKEDIRLMKLAGCNTMSINIFAWATLEPEEGRYNFEWLDKIMDDFATNEIFAVLATPSGARPNWLAQKYPEVLRIDSNRVKQLFGTRHNHCFTSPIYRQKTSHINHLLAQRYQNHPALIAWHISNEFGGECHCPLCQQAFREWIKTRYDNDLGKLNKAWWANFWSHTYTSWGQIESPSNIGEPLLHGLNLDWKRFVTYQTTEFMKNEILPLRRLTPNIPITTNLMGTYEGLNPWELVKELDIVSWDNYPTWHIGDSDVDRAAYVSMVHDINRSLKNGKPFMLMESTPSMTNWTDVPKLKRPGMHMLSSLQAVAHGSDTVQYFQWRKSRGSSEKFHGAVVGHSGHENTRVFNDVTALGETLSKLDSIVGTSVDTEVAMIYDWENKWAFDDAKGLHNERKDYIQTVQQHYAAFWQNGVSLDVISMDCDFSKYKIIVAPILYMLQPGVAKRLETFVENGGTFITTYWSGMVDQNDLCFLGGFPGPLRKLLGIWSEESDALEENVLNVLIPLPMPVSVFANGPILDLKRTYQIRDVCELIHSEGAQVLAEYGKDFYAGRPALTKNTYGKGSTYYIASRNEAVFHFDLYTHLIDSIGIKRNLCTNLPTGVTVQKRSDDDFDYLFVMNFNNSEQVLSISEEKIYQDYFTGQIVNTLALSAYDCRILKTAK